MRSYFLLALLVQLSACNIVLGVDDPTPRPEPAPDGGAGAGTQEEPECTTNAQCLGDTAEFDPYACVNGHCIELLTDECPLLLPQTDRGWLESLRSTNVPPIIFGAFTDMESSSIYSARARNFDLAFTEIMRAAGGIPAPGGKKRAILALACQNQYANPEDFDRAIDHLIEEVQVPGILPVLETHNLLHAFERSGASHHVLFMSPSGAENALLDNMNYGLVWTMLPGGAALAPTYAPLLDLTVEHLRNTGALGKNEPVRVALVRADDYASMNEMASAITDEIRFNGKSANDNAPYYFQSFSVSSSVLASSPPDYTAAAKALVDFAPHVVISSATDEFLDVFMPTLEYELADHPPSYLLSPLNCYRKSLWNNVMPCDPTDTSCHDTRTRVLGVNYAAAADPTIYDAYQARFDAAYSGFPAASGKENFYDAAYYLIYSAAAASASPLKGDDLSQGMERLLAGPAFNVGPDDVASAYRALGVANSSITLNGAMGPPDFDRATGARQTPGTVWCVDDTYTLRMDVLRLNADGRLTGEFPCFALP
jgi:hypothetical protein